MNSLKLSDDTIAQIAKILQVAILTGTDVVDNLRQLELVTSEDGRLTMSEDYAKNFETNITSMLEGISEENG